MKIKYKLLVLLIITAAVPLLISLFFSYYSIQDNLSNKFMETNKIQVDQTTYALQLSFDDIDRKLLSIYQTTDFYRYLTNSNNNSFEWLEQQRKTVNLLLILAQSLNRQSNIYLFNENFGNIYIVEGKSMNVEIQSNVDEANELWINNSKKNRGKFTIEKISSDYSTQNFPIAIISRSVSDVLTNKNIGVLAIDISTEFFNNTIGEDLTRDNVSIIDSNGVVVYENHGAWDQPDQYLIVRSVKNSYGWQVVKFVPKSILKEVAWDTVKPILFWGITFLLVGITLSLIFSLEISKPIIKLTHNMIKASKGDFTVYSKVMNINSQNEINIMAVQFNKMITKIDELIKNEYKLKIQEYSARMEALQAQINPHFLYNTLMTIYSEALDMGSESICKMVKMLSSILRYTIEGENNIVCLSNEVDHIRNYLEIQKYRYEEKLSFTIEIPEGFLNIPVVKLSIQPIVENAIIHGIATKGKGMVKIYAISEDEQIKLVVEDTGTGISLEDIALIEENLKNDSGFKGHIGIYNVHQRILFSFPGSTGVKIESQEGKGTKVSVSWKVTTND